MPADPTEPDTFEDEANAMTEIDVEAPVNDAAEQHAEVSPQHDDPMTGVDPGVANEADLVEQARVVELNEDEYR
ncbi:hypothetical protein [Streptomyces chattanoogensis]|uniref:DUF5709 domain-containing protein n=1 Tax=Streptomyces chattanoogensis TaxID=66876 RepID=A0A0N0H455_9ACTN|nr:hypothetical protein [Streptomyces chattanoogensis]KPC66831.1 hypothetical protein ADL29_01150 [Streptomyces chattanoogensis]